MSSENPELENNVYIWQLCSLLSVIYRYISLPTNGKWQKYIIYKAHSSITSVKPKSYNSTWKQLQIPFTRKCRPLTLLTATIQRWIRQLRISLRSHARRYWMSFLHRKRHFLLKPKVMYCLNKQGTNTQTHTNA